MKAQNLATEDRRQKAEDEDLLERLRETALRLASDCGEAQEPDPTRSVAHSEFESVMTDLERRLGVAA